MAEKLTNELQLYRVLLEPDANLFGYLRVYCEVSSLAAVIVGCLVVCGWGFNVEVVKSVFPGLAAMKVNTGIGLAFSGASLCLLLANESRSPRRFVAHILTSMVALIGAGTLGE